MFFILLLCWANMFLIIIVLGKHVILLLCWENMFFYYYADQHVFFYYCAEQTCFFLLLLCWTSMFYFIIIILLGKHVFFVLLFRANNDSYLNPSEPSALNWRLKLLPHATPDRPSTHATPAHPSTHGTPAHPSTHATSDHPPCVLWMSPLAHAISGRCVLWMFSKNRLKLLLPTIQNFWGIFLPAVRAALA